MQRRMMAAIGLFGVSSLLLAGCAPGGESDDGGSKALTFTSWGGAYQEAETEAFLKPFEASTGIAITQDSPTDYVKIKTQVETGNVTWDVTDNDPFFVNPNCGVLFEEIDTDIVDTSVFAEASVSKCAVPIIQFSQLLMYNTDTYGTNGPTSWADFFDVEKFPGTRSIGNYPTYGAIEAALLGDGVAPDKLYPLDFDRAFAKLDTIKDHLVFWDSGALQEQTLLSGEADMVIAWSGRAATTVRQGAPFEPVWNGGIIAYNVLAVTKGTKNKDAAMELIAYATGAEGQTKLGEVIAYSPTNLKATPKLDDIGQKFNVSKKEILDVSVFQDMTWWGDNLDEGVDRWTTWSVG